MQSNTLRRVEGMRAYRGADPMTDTEIIGRILEGEQRLFEVLMRRYNERIYRVVRSVLGRDDGVSDVMQDAYILAFSRLSTFAGTGSFPAWLSRIAVREAVRFQRLEQRYDMREPSSDAFESLKQNLTQYEERDVELRDLLASSIDDLPPKMRAIFVMRQVEQLSTQETAESLGISTAGVKTGVHRARQRLRRSLERALGAEMQNVYPFGNRRCDLLVEQVLERISLDVPPTDRRGL